MPYLEQLVSALGRQTAVPGEVVISLSGVEERGVQEVVSRTTQAATFPLRFLTSSTLLHPGESRQRASEITTGDVIVYQDADDVPHPQRIEIIRHFFQDEKLVHLVHTESLEKVDYEAWAGRLPRTRFLAALAFFRRRFSPEQFAGIKTYTNDGTYRQVVTGHVSHGKPAIRRSLLQSVRWPGMLVGEDQLFNRCAVEKYPGGCLFIDCCLYLYRNSRSSITAGGSS